MDPWPVRWGDPGEEKIVKVYSNCDEAELFVNGKSYGVKKRNSQDFPAAGLRWMVPMVEGKNTFQVIGRKGNIKVEDRISQQYQVAKWGEPARLVAEEIREADDTVTVQVNLVDETNVLCLDARNWIRFSLAGDGILIDNQGTSTGSRLVQAYNGRAIIRVKANGGKNVICAQSPGIPTVFLDIQTESARR